jgi:hypothetical protein
VRVDVRSNSIGPRGMEALREHVERGVLISNFMPAPLRWEGRDVRTPSPVEGEDDDVVANAMVEPVGA